MSEITLPPELAIPKSRREVIGVIAFEVFILFFVLLAVHNLFQRVAIIASILWLLLIVAVVWSSCRKDGVKRFLIELLGAYSLKHFVRVVPPESGPARFRSGIGFFAIVFCTLRSPSIRSKVWIGIPAKLRVWPDAI